MTSSSTLGGSNITLQFDLNRDINAAARDVEAAINAARGYLPPNLPSNPNYRKVNPADAPIFQIALTSPVLSKGEMYDAASTIMAQKFAQVRGVGQVFTYGSALPGVRVELNPTIAEQIRNRPRSGARRAERGQREYSQGAVFERSADFRAGRKRSDFQSGGLPYADCRVSQRHARARFRSRRCGGFGGGPAQRGIFERQAERAGDHQPPAGRQHHRHGGSHSRRASRT